MEKLFISELSKIKINIKKANIDKNAKVAFKKTYVRKKDIRLFFVIIKTAIPKTITVRNSRIKYLKVSASFVNELTNANKEEIKTKGRIWYALILKIFLQ